MSSVFTLPNERKLRELTAILNVGDLESYLMKIVSVLSPRDRWVSISVDGISVTPKVQLKNGEIHGQDQSGEVATEMIGFMANSMFGHQVKDMLHLQECSSMTGKLQAEKVSFHFISQTISSCCAIIKVQELSSLLERVGFKVLLIIADNHRLNMSMFKHFLDQASGNPFKAMNAFPNPFDPSRPIFLQYDSTHIFKNFRNCLLRVKGCFRYPDFNDFSIPREADYGCLREYFNQTIFDPLRMGHRLRKEAVDPNNYQKQNVSFVKMLFCPSTIGALKEFFKPGRSF